MQLEQPPFLPTAFSLRGLPAGTVSGLDRQDGVLFSDSWVFMETQVPLCSEGEDLPMPPSKLTYYATEGYEQYFPKCSPWDPSPERWYVTEGSKVGQAWETLPSVSILPESLLHMNMLKVFSAGSSSVPDVQI